MYRYSHGYYCAPYIAYLLTYLTLWIKKIGSFFVNLVTKSFDSQDWKFICINYNKASWSKIENNKGICLNCDAVIYLLVWLIDNTYVTVGDKIFRQCIGIPMSTDCAPYLANLFLFAYEFDFMNKLIKDKTSVTILSSKLNNWKKILK